MTFVKKNLRFLLITSVIIAMIFISWMFQGVILDENHKEKMEKQSYDNFFMNYYDKEEGIVFDVLEERNYQNTSFSFSQVEARAYEYLKSKNVEIDHFSLIIEQGIYTNISLGLTEVTAWRVMFIDQTKQIEGSEDLSAGSSMGSDHKSVVPSEKDKGVNQEEEANESRNSIDASIEQKLRYWIVLDAEEGKILTAYANGN